MLFKGNLLALTEETKSNTIHATSQPKHKNTTTQNTYNIQYNIRLFWVDKTQLNTRHNIKM